MLRYIGKRLLQMIPILLVVAILIFTLMYFVPGDPVKIILGNDATEVDIARVKQELGLNEPYIIQLTNYLKNLLRLDFGKSFFSGLAVKDELVLRFPNTLILTVMCVSFSIIVGIPIGISCAMRADKLTDRVWLFLTLLCNSMPGFWLALMLVLLFSRQLGWLPSSGVGSAKYFILPVLANSLGALAGIARQTRASMLEVIRADFISTAKSKGISRREVIWKHALPNALIPIITVIGGSFGMMLGGATITESIFSIPGIGLYMMSGINNRDYPVVRGCILYIAFMFAVMMLLTDLVYAFVDPRIKAQYVRAKKQPEKAEKKSEEGSENQ